MIHELVDPRTGEITLLFPPVYYRVPSLSPKRCNQTLRPARPPSPLSN